MIRVTIEMVPYGDESRAKVLHVGVIANSGTGSQTHGNYWFSLSQRGTRKVWRKGAVEGFARKRLDAWYLLYRVLQEALGDRGKAL